MEEKDVMLAEVFCSTVIPRKYILVFYASLIPPRKCKQKKTKQIKQKNKIKESDLNCDIKILVWFILLVKNFIYYERRI